MTAAGLTLGARRVLVTGGGSGIGRATAELLLARGGLVAVAGRRRDRLEALASAWPGRAFPLPCDLSSVAEREHLVERARALLGGLDGVVQSAGQVNHQKLGEIDEQALRTQLEVDLVAPLRVGEQALTQLEDGGAMVLVSSTLALRPVETSAVYSAAKAGLLAVNKCLALAGAPRRLRINALCPGVVDTPMMDFPPPLAPQPAVAALSSEPAAGHGPPPVPVLTPAVPPNSSGHQRRRRLEALHPLGIGKAEEVAAAIVWLLQAPWTTGSSVVMDGGLLLRE